MHLENYTRTPTPFVVGAAAHRLAVESAVAIICTLPEYESQLNAFGHVGPNGTIAYITNEVETILLHSDAVEALVAGMQPDGSLTGAAGIMFSVHLGHAVDLVFANLRTGHLGPAGEGPPGSGTQTPQLPPGGMEAPPIPTVPLGVYTPHHAAPVQGVPIGAAVEPAAQGPAPAGGAAPPAEHQGDGAGATSPARSVSSVSSGWTARSDGSTGSQLFASYQETARARDDVTMVTPERQARLLFPTIAMSDSGSESDPASSPTPGMKPGPSHVLHWPPSPSPPAPQA